MAAVTPTPQQHRRMHVLWRIAGVTDRADRLALTSRIVHRRIVTSNDLDRGEAQKVLRYMTELDNRGQLYTRAQEWLAEHRAVAS